MSQELIFLEVGVEFCPDENISGPPKNGFCP
jgi:hypothetical protein